MGVREIVQHVTMISVLPRRHAEPVTYRMIEPQNLKPFLQAVDPIKLDVLERAVPHPVRADAFCLPIMVMFPQRGAYAPAMQQDNHFHALLDEQAGFGLACFFAKLGTSAPDPERRMKYRHLWNHAAKVVATIEYHEGLRPTSARFNMNAMAQHCDRIGL